MSTTVKSVFIETRIKKTINYKFGSFSEMLDFLMMKGNRQGRNVSRTIEYHEKKVRGGQKHKRNGKLCFDVQKDIDGNYEPSWFGKKSHSCLMEYTDKDGLTRVESLFPYFDKKDRPLDQAFEAAFHLEDFVGVEVEHLEKNETHRSASYRWENP